MSKNTATARKQMYGGTHGNVAKEVFRAQMSADPAATEFTAGVIPAGTEVTDLSVITDNLGAGTNVDVGYRYIDNDNGTDDPDYFGNFTTTSANRFESKAKPMRFESDVNLVFTLKGGAGTGEFIAMPQGITRGVR